MALLRDLAIFSSVLKGPFCCSLLPFLLDLFLPCMLKGEVCEKKRRRNRTKKMFRESLPNILVLSCVCATDILPNFLLKYLASVGSILPRVCRSFRVSFLPLLLKVLFQAFSAKTQWGARFFFALSRDPTYTRRYCSVFCYYFITISVRVQGDEYTSVLHPSSLFEHCPVYVLGGWVCTERRPALHNTTPPASAYTLLTSSSSSSSALRPARRN